MRRGEPLLAADSVAADIGWRDFFADPKLEEVIARAGALPTLVEWDNRVPEWPVLLAEARRAQAVLDARQYAERKERATRPETGDMGETTHRTAG